MTYRHRRKELCGFCKEMFIKFRKNSAHLRLFLGLDEIMVEMKEYGKFR